MSEHIATRLSRIVLSNVIPDVFTPEDVRDSQIWLRDFSFERGKRYLVKAASGSGKSSLCSFIYHNRTDYRGTISYDRRDARLMKADEVSDLRCRHISLLPQELRLFGELSAIDNVRLKNRLTGHCSEDEIMAMFDRLGIADRADRQASTLSIGQMQRVAIIRALCQPFDFIILDEPVSHLDEENNRTVALLVDEAARRLGAGIIATSVGNNLMLPDEDIIHINL